MRHDQFGGLTTDERKPLRELQRENRELKRSNAILRKASAFFARGCMASSNRRLRSGPSAYYERKAPQRDPTRRCARARSEDDLRNDISRVLEDNFRVYGAQKVWRQLNREDISAARCTVEHLMKDMGISRAVRGRDKINTMPDKTPCKPPDLID